MADEEEQEKELEEAPGLTEEEAKERIAELQEEISDRQREVMSLRRRALEQGRKAARENAELRQSKRVGDRVGLYGF